MEKTYNGWSNYETWVTKLWMDNDYRSYNYFKEEGSNYEGHPYEFAEHIKNVVEEEFIPELQTGLASDLLGHAIGNVNWYEIAESILDDLNN
jgi:hypothetical protein